MNNNYQNAGDNSQQIIGNKNIIFNLFTKKECYKILSDIIREIVDNLTGEIEMNIDKIPAEVLEKIDYNNIPLHKNEFVEFVPYLSKVEYIMEKMYGKKSEVVINRIKYNWNDICSTYPNNNKDFQLYRFNETMVKKINTKVINKYSLEYIEIGIELIIFYAFTKCQILDNPN